MSEETLPFDGTIEPMEEPQFKTGFMEKIFYFFELNNEDIKDPRTQSFGRMLHHYLCPFSSFLTFSFLMSVLLCIIFAIQMSIDGLVEGEAKAFLEIEKSGTLTPLFYNQYTLVKGKPS
jgi:hypothetical protein